MTENPKQLARRLCDQIQKRGKNRGLLIAFEGPDGSGKTTQRKLFKDWLVGEGYDVVTTKWNSSKLIKPIIKARKNMRSINQQEFCLLHAADFRHRLENDIMPALVADKMVVADRFLFTALARDAARGLELDWLLHIYSPLYWPDIVFYFSVSPETSGKRIAATRTPKYYEAGQDVTNINDPFESYRQFISRVIQEYEALAVELATKRAKLDDIKQKLAKNRLATPLFNTELFTRHIEMAYATMYRRYQAGLPPDHIRIETMDK